MITDIDIWRAAKQLVDQHGPDAATEAAMMADRFGADGNFWAQRVWLRIMQAIEWLQDLSGRDPLELEH